MSGLQVERANYQYGCFYCRLCIAFTGRLANQYTVRGQAETATAHLGAVRNIKLKLHPRATESEV